MDRFRTLEPVKLYPAGKKSSRPPQKVVGRLPSDLHLVVVANLTIPDIPAYARCCKATAAFIRDDNTWRQRWKALLVDVDPAFQKILDGLEQKANERLNMSRSTAPPTISVDDDFGDFADANVLSQPPAEEMGDFVGAFSHVTLSGTFSRSPPSTPAKDSYKAKFVRAFNLLRPLAHLLSSPPHLVLSELFAHLPSSLYQQAKLLRFLARFLSPRVQPFRKWELIYVSLRSAMDRYDSTLLGAFDMADGKGDEPAMREAAESSWEIWDSTIGDWEMGKVWAEKREIFYQHDRWKALDNFTWVPITLVSFCVPNFVQERRATGFSCHGRIHGRYCYCNPRPRREGREDLPSLVPSSAPLLRATCERDCTCSHNAHRSFDANLSSRLVTTLPPCYLMLAKYRRRRT